MIIAMRACLLVLITEVSEATLETSAFISPEHVDRYRLALGQTLFVHCTLLQLYCIGTTKDVGNGTLQHSNPDPRRNT